MAETKPTEAIINGSGLVINRNALKTVMIITATTLLMINNSLG
ncbi:hypothetical protein [Pseudoalteromonas sp. 45-MNA-CIBAN-0466]